MNYVTGEALSTTNYDDEFIGHYGKIREYNTPD